MRCRRGFTLIEVLISIALIMVLLGSMFGFLLDLMSTRRRILDDTARQRAAAALIEHVEADLRACLVGDRVRGAGVEGDTERLTVMSRGVAARLAGRGRGDPEVLGDLQRSEYRFDPDHREIEARRGDDGAFESLGPAFKVRFRYHDSKRWLDSFDSLAEGRLPVAVEVAVWLDPWPGESQPDDGARGDGAAGGPPQRLTFDATAGFDEEAVARRTDMELLDEPRPDRFRVIAIADAAAGTDPEIPAPEPAP